jgi:hypothetical protein
MHALLVEYEVDIDVSILGLRAVATMPHFGVCLMLDPVLDFVNVMPETTVLTSTASGPAVLS